MKASDIIQLKSETERLQRENPLALPLKTRKSINKLGDFLKTDLLKRVDSEEKEEVKTDSTEIKPDANIVTEPESKVTNNHASSPKPELNSEKPTTTSSTALTPKTQHTRNLRAYLLKKKQELAKKQINQLTESDKDIKNTKTSLLTFDLDENTQHPSQEELPSSQAKFPLKKFAGLSQEKNSKKPSPKPGYTRTLNMQSILVRKEKSNGVIELVQEHVLLPNHTDEKQKLLEFKGKKDLKSCLKTKIHQKKVDKEKRVREEYLKKKEQYKKDMEEEDNMEDLLDEETFLNAQQPSSQKNNRIVDDESNCSKMIQAWEDTEPHDELARILKGGSTTRTEN